MRNAVISVAAAILVMGAGVLTCMLLVGKSGNDALHFVEMDNKISGPNLYRGSYKQDFGFLSGTLEYQTYKVVEGIPIAWNRDKYKYNTWGNFSRFSGDYSSIQLPDPQMQKAGFTYSRYFNSNTGQREMLFYLPEGNYGKYLNDLTLLDEIDKKKYVEMAISFDKNYSVEQITSMLPNGVHAAWYWVDTYYDKERFKSDKLQGKIKLPDGSTKIFEVGPEPSYAVHGFGQKPVGGNVTEKDFLTYLEAGLNQGNPNAEYQKIYDYLRKEKDKPVESDVKIIGVVVTGTPDALKALNGKDFVKASVLGAVVDKY